MLWNVTVKSATHTSFRHSPWKLSYIMKKKCASCPLVVCQWKVLNLDVILTLVWSSLSSCYWGEKRGQKNSDLVSIISWSQKRENLSIFSDNLVNDFIKAIFFFFHNFSFIVFFSIFKMQRNILLFFKSTLDQGNNKTYFLYWSISESELCNHSGKSTGLVRYEFSRGLSRKQSFARVE